MKDATYLHIKLLSKVNVYCGREFPSEMELEDRKMVNLMHVPSGKQNVRLLFHKCLIYRKVIILEFPYRIELDQELPHGNLGKFCLWFLEV